MKMKDVKSEEKNIENRLKSIAKLQRSLSEIDKIDILQGELPQELRDIEDDIEGAKSRLNNYSTSANALKSSMETEKRKIEASETLLAKYRKQLDNVRNNREYDNLQKEIEYQELEVLSSQKKIKEFGLEFENRKKDIADLKAKIELRIGDLEAKKGELDQITKETKEDKARLIEVTKKLEDAIEDERLLTAFYRIREASRNGLAVVPIDRDSCGGCFNRIPPQRQLEIKLPEKISICEYCGRILVDEDFFLTDEEIAEKNALKAREEESLKKKTSRRMRTSSKQN